MSWSYLARLHYAVHRITGEVLSRSQLQRLLPERFPADAAILAMLLEGEFSTGKKSLVEVPPLGDCNHLDQSRTSIFIESEACIPVLNEKLTEQEIHHGTLFHHVLPSTNEADGVLPVRSLHQPCFNLRKYGQGCPPARLDSEGRFKPHLHR